MPHNPLEAAALRWVPGNGPVDVRPLTAGLVNDSWQVARDGRLYSLRMSQSIGAELGVDRDWECRVLAQASAAGLAPAVVRCEPGGNLLIAEWVNGRPWTAEEAQALPNIQSMARLLHRVHALPIPQPARVMSPRSWIEHYAAAASHGETAGRRSRDLHFAADSRLDRWSALPAADPVLCHGDLHRLNLMVADRLMLLDWEYAHVTDPFWDLAGWISNNDWTEETASVLLAIYLGHIAGPAELERMRLLAWLYDYVCLVWSELYLSRQPGTQQQLETSGGAEAAFAEAALAGATRTVSVRAEELASRLANALR